MSRFAGWAFAVACCLGALLLQGAATAADKQYIIQPEDVLSVRVSGEPALSKNYPVDEKGFITMDLVGKVRVAGLTSAQATEKLTTELGKFLKLFDVKLDVVGEIGYRVLVYGEVAKQGQHKVQEGTKLLEVLAAAGGPTANADKKRISLARKETGKSETLDLDALLADPAKDVVVYPGDTITVPSKSTRSVRIDGSVTTNGPVSLDDFRTAYAAIQSAKPTPAADYSRVQLRRKGSNIPLIIDLEGVRAGRVKDDLELAEGDAIYVPSKFTGLVRIRGEVKTPGEKDLNGQVQLLDFILKDAGGWGDKADKQQIQIIRKDANGKKVVKKVDLLAVEEGRKAADDPELTLEPDDDIFVPPGVATLYGEVKQTGEKALGKTRQILDFINAQGGGFTDNADRTRVMIVRNGKLHKTIDVDKIARGESPPDNPEFEVQAGDEIRVPNNETQRFVIIGGVKKPGAYPVKPGMTLLDAIAVAENLNTNANTKKIVVARKDQFNEKGELKVAAENGAGGNGGKTESKRSSKEKDEDLAKLGMIEIDLKKLGKDPKLNVAINAGDRIFIPEDQPAAQGPGVRKPSLFRTILGMVPLATIFMGGGGFGGRGFYPYGLGGYGGYGGYGY